MSEFKDNGCILLGHIAINRNTGADLLKRALFAFSKRPRVQTISDHMHNSSKVRDIWQLLAEALSVSAGEIQAKIHAVEHRCAHLTSAFFVFRSLA